MLQSIARRSGYPGDAGYASGKSFDLADRRQSDKRFHAASSPSHSDTDLDTLVHQGNRRPVSILGVVSIRQTKGGGGPSNAAE